MATVFKFMITIAVVKL